MNLVSYLGRGIYHERQGLPCQDAVSIRLYPNTNVVLALSDGASKAKYAEDAAISTVKSLCTFFSERMLSGFLAMDASAQKKAVLSAVRKKIIQNEHYLGQEAPEFSATSLFAVNDGKHVMIGHLGDGAAFAVDREGRLLFVSEPDRISANRTWFAVSPDAEEHFRFHTLDAAEISCLMLISDGPYTMFHNRNGGNAAATAVELAGWMQKGEIRNNADLRTALNQMAYLPSERMDDWSLAAWIADQRPEIHLPTFREQQEVVSMLREEEEKYAAK